MSETGVQSLPSLDSWYQVTQNVTDLQYQSAFSWHREHSYNKLNIMSYVNHTLFNDVSL